MRLIYKGKSSEIHEIFEFAKVKIEAPETKLALHSSKTVINPVCTTVRPYRFQIWTQLSDYKPFCESKNCCRFCTPNVTNLYTLGWDPSHIEHFHTLLSVLTTFTHYYQVIFIECCISLETWAGCLDFTNPYNWTIDHKFLIFQLPWLHKPVQLGYWSQIVEVSAPLTSQTCTIGLLITNCWGFSSLDFTNLYNCTIELLITNCWGFSSLDFTNLYNWTIDHKLLRFQLPWLHKIQRWKSTAKGLRSASSPRVILVQVCEVKGAETSTICDQ